MSIKLARVDFRLMHGQVVTNWIKVVNANAILIVDDELASNQFLAKVFLMAAPPGVKISIKSVDTSGKWFATGKQNSLDLLVLFKSVECAKRAYDAGFKYDALQIGGLGNGKDKVVISKDISLNKEEAGMLQELTDKGVDVTLQILPKDEKIQFTEIASKVL